MAAAIDRDNKPQPSQDKQTPPRSKRGPVSRQRRIGGGGQ